ncbi:MAG: hypothetical protein COB66_04415 [Coxiella sp. (in: Bacteria)]|nr:MAG: hypothetical protein COB66_04415 [Coxiella sp. (in: g-proteobacteria)]
MILYLLLRIAILVFGYLPFWLLYRFSDVLSVVCNLLGVRKKTIHDNLDGAFPDLSSKQKRKLTKGVYRNFFDVMFVEMIKSFTISTHALAKRFDPGDVAILKRYHQEGQSLISVTGHYANWEWGVSAAVDYNCVAFYKPLKNRYMDRYIRQNRSRHHFELASVTKPVPTFLKYRDQATFYFLIADKQNVKKKHLKRVMWLPFLGKKSPFLLGPEKYARSFNYPVFYSKVRRVGRGRYQHQLIELCADPSTLDEGELTRRWVAILEEQVQADPAAWLWFWATTRSRQDALHQNG